MILIRDFCSIIIIGISDSILQILNSNESQKPKEQTYCKEFFVKTIFVNLIPIICLGNAIWTLFIFNKRISNNHYLLGYIRKILYFGLNGIQNTRIFRFSKKISYLSVFSLLFSKKELKTTKKQSKNTKQKIFSNIIITFLSIIFVLLFIINIAYFKKQQLSILKEVAKFLKNPKNYPIVPLLWLNDNEIIYNLGLGCESESIDQGRSYVDKNIDISNCFFSRSSSYSGDGGVIYVNGGSYSMNINCSMFNNCVCSLYGGAIYFISSNSCLRMICANSCSCGAYYYAHFARLQASQVNQVEYLSVSNCSHTTSGYYSIWLSSGNQRVDNTNSSMNNANQVSGISIISPSSFTSSHSTFSNNKVSNSICIYFLSTSEISMSYANIVHNNSPYSHGVVTVFEAFPKMMYCIFKNNQNTLFYVYEGSLEVSHSFIDHSGSFSTSTSVSTSNNNSFTKGETFFIEFLGSKYCMIPIVLFTTERIVIAIVLIISFFFSVLLFRKRFSFIEHSDSTIGSDHDDFIWKSSI